MLSQGLPWEIKLPFKAFSPKIIHLLNRKLYQKIAYHGLNISHRKRLICLSSEGPSDNAINN